VLVGHITIDRMTSFSKSSDVIGGSWRACSAYRKMGDFPYVIQVFVVHPSHRKMWVFFFLFCSQLSFFEEKK
jgi:hypothetical protein